MRPVSSYWTHPHEPIDEAGAASHLERPKRDGTPHDGTGQDVAGIVQAEEDSREADDDGGRQEQPSHPRCHPEGEDEGSGRVGRVPGGPRPAVRRADGPDDLDGWPLPSDDVLETVG